MALYLTIRKIKDGVEGIDHLKGLTHRDPSRAMSSKTEHLDANLAVQEGRNYLARFQYKGN